MRQTHPQLDLPHAGLDDSELCHNGRPADWRNPTPRQPYHLLVIGAGPAGLVAARAAAALGARVALVEKHLLGGLSMNYGCVPSQALIGTSRLYAEMGNSEAYGARSPAAVEVDFPLAMARMRRVRARASRVDSTPRIAAAGIDLFFGTATFVGPDMIEVDGLLLRFKKAMIATGGPFVFSAKSDARFVQADLACGVAAPTLPWTLRIPRQAETD